MHRRTAVLVGAALVAAACSVLLAAPPATADDRADAVEAAIDAWRPAESGTWTAGTPTAVDAQPLAGCRAGTYRQFTRETDGAMIELDWADCGDAEAASAAVAALGQGLGLVAATDSPAGLLDGGQTLALRPGWGGVYHLWSQGGFALLAYRWCGIEDPAACRAAMGDEVTDVAAAIGLPVAPAVPGTAAEAGDPILSWRPSNGPWTVAEAGNLPQSDACRVGGTAFTRDDGRIVVLTWARCPDAKQAAIIDARYWAGADLDTTGLSPAFAGVHDSFGAQTVDGALRISRHWVQGRYYLGLETVCAEEVARCGDTNVADARSLATWVPGPVAESSVVQSLASFGLLAAGVPLLTLLLLHVPRRLIARRRSSGYRVPAPATEEFEDVGPLVRRVRRERTIRRTLTGVLVVVGYVALVMWLGAMRGATLAFGLAVFFGPFVLTAAVTVLLRRLRRPHPLLDSGRTRPRRGPATVAGYALRGLAVLLAVTALEVYGLAVLFLMFDGLQGGEVVQGALERAAAGGDMVAGLRLAFLFLNNTGLVALVFFAVLALPIFAAYLLDRLGQRLTRSSLSETLATDTRPYFLYLRGFDEDDLRIDESLGRRGFLELLAPFGRPRFEEVVVEHLTTAGPVIAISRGTSGLADLGAAKATLADDEWRDRVREWVGGARAVIMSATPSEVRAGLLWEVEHLAGREERPPIVLLVAPWPRGELTRRFTGFVDDTRAWEPFASLAQARYPDGLHVATWSRARGWRAYGAQRRWDWSYAASLRQALESGDI
ncbi:MAG TPA: hypothetical protein VL294_09465 [Pseudolysinimonas sp.]|nr:hypothetical protein [Pseudolysinimonas sp.]